MHNGDKFFIIFLITVLVIRVFLFIYPIPSPTIEGFRIHHYMYGIIGIPVAIMTGSLPIYAVSVGFLEDEFAYKLIGGKNHKDNYSLPSILGTICFVMLTFAFRNYLVSPFK